MKHLQGSRRNGEQATCFFFFHLWVLGMVGLREEAEKINLYLLWGVVSLGEEGKKSIYLRERGLFFSFFPIWVFIKHLIIIYLLP